MKKILILLAVVLTVVCAIGQTRLVRIPYKVMAADTSRPIIVHDTFHVPCHRTVRSSVVQRSYGTDEDSICFVQLTLADGHTERFKCSNNFTLADDIVGSEYEYTVLDSITKVVARVNGKVDIGILWVNAYDEGRYCYGKIYSYSTNKTYMIKMDSHLYLKYREQGFRSKRWVKVRGNMISYDDFGHLLKNTESYFYYQKYDFVASDE